MGTVIRPEIAKNKKYWVSKHRYYELKHFCLQYPYWKRMYTDLDGYKTSHYSNLGKSNLHSDPTLDLAEKRLLYFEKMRLVEQTAIAADVDLSNYILKAVTEGISYDTLKSVLNIPCSKNMYYDRYRKFFWLLSKERN